VRCVGCSVFPFYVFQKLGRFQTMRNALFARIFNVKYIKNVLYVCVVSYHFNIISRSVPTHA
jgi:hypothetical protein